MNILTKLIRLCGLWSATGFQPNRCVHRPGQEQEQQVMSSEAHQRQQQARIEQHTIVKKASTPSGAMGWFPNQVSDERARHLLQCSGRYCRHGSRHQLHRCRHQHPESKHQFEQTPNHAEKRAPHRGRWGGFHIRQVREHTCSAMFW